MKLSKLILLALAMTILAALGTATAASAELALLDILPEPTEKAPITFSGELAKETKAILKSSVLESAVECTTAPTTGELTSPRLGLVVIGFLGCTAKVKEATVKCTGLSDTVAGHITVHAEIHLWRGELVTKEGKTVLHLAVVVFLLLHVHFTCGGVVLVLVLECVAGLLNTTNVLTNKMEVKLVENEAKTTINDITLVENEKLVLEGCVLKSSVNEGAESSKSVEIATATIEKFKQGGKEIEVLLMA